MVIMTEADLRVLVQNSEELLILREVDHPEQKKHNYYLGANVGTYGVGVGAGIIW